MSVNSLAQPQFVSSGNISPARVVVRSATVARTAAQGAAATTTPIGLSVNAVKFSNNPFDGTAYSYTAVSGDVIPYVGEGSVGYATSGAAIASGDLGKPLVCTTGGKVITATPLDAGTLSYTIGYPLATASDADELIPVLISIGPIFL